MKEKYEAYDVVNVLLLNYIVFDVYDIGYRLLTRWNLASKCVLVIQIDHFVITDGLKLSI